MNILEAVEDIESYIDQVLDLIDKYGSPEIYEYYSDNRDMLIKYADDDISAVDAADDLITSWNDNQDDIDFEIEDENDSDVIFNDLAELYQSGEVLKNPTGADGQWVKENDGFVISKAISENDVETLEDYLENGVSDNNYFDEDNIIDFDDQYSKEFEQDYVLLTKNVVKNGDDINDALKFMLDYREDFIISPFDLYNLFVSKNTDVTILKQLVNNSVEAQPDMIFYDDITINDVAEYLELN